MSKIVNLTIKNFRGIKDLSLDFYNKSLVCFIGRGDSGKSTILDAISSVLSSSWNMAFHDTDFHECNLENPIEVDASLIDFPDKFLSDEKYGLHIRSLNVQSNEISDEIPQDDIEGISKPLLTVKLLVDRTLEPKWTITNNRGMDEKLITATDRAALNCSMVSDYVDRHFSWSKGNPLYNLLKAQEAQKAVNNDNVVIESLRQAKAKIDEYPFSELKEVTNIIKQQAAAFGLNVSETHTTLDFKELSIKDGRISLHEKAIPFRLKGKGSKRLASFAIQSAMGKNGGIMLVDEIEQGLEPDRVKQLIRTLKEQQAGQVFLTTHSREVVTELNASSLLLILKESNGSKIEARLLDSDDDNLQKSVRACPEAFFAQKVIVCEGATEIGICRAIDKWRVSQGEEQMSFRGCAYVDGTGNTLVERAREIQLTNIAAALFCDSDDSSVNKKKEGLKELGVEIFDCALDNCIEQQVFSDLPWEGVKELLIYAREQHTDAFDKSFSAHLSTTIDQWKDNEELRSKVVSEFKTKPNGSAGKKWFKAIHHGEILGRVALKYMDEMKDYKHLYNVLSGLSAWIDS